MRLKSLAVIGLVAVPMLVQAECAWVLWQRVKVAGAG
jgi:hypothetical protein